VPAAAVRKYFTEAAESVRDLADYDTDFVIDLGSRKRYRIEVHNQPDAA